MATSVLQPVILENFTQFFNKIIENKPYTESFTEHLNNLLKNLKDDDFNYSKTKSFIETLKSKGKSPHSSHL